MQDHMPQFNTIDCRYHVAQYNMILHTSLQLLSHSLNSQNTSHTLPWRASYGIDFVRIWEKIDCVIMALHCNWNHMQNHTSVDWLLKPYTRLPHSFIKVLYLWACLAVFVFENVHDAENWFFKSHHQYVLLTYGKLLQTKGVFSK